MKKNIGLITSLLIFPLLASCNGGSTTKLLTEEEFNNAIKFEGIEYAQALYETPYSSNSEGCISYEFSPTAYLNAEKENSKSTSIYSGKYILKKDDCCLEYTKDPEEEDWEGPMQIALDKFIKPNFLYVKYFSFIEKNLNLAYEDFNYNGGTKTYSASKPLENVNYELSLKFENKKVTNFVSKITSSDPNSKSLTYTTTLSITYEEKTPIQPF